MINVHVSNAVNKMKGCFPNAEIGLCSILPRKDKGLGQLKCILTYPPTERQGTRSTKMYSDIIVC